MSGQPEALAGHEIARRATRGAASYVFRSGASQAIQAVSALVVARILLPEQYGVFALALTLVGAARIFGDLGITYSLVVNRRVTDEDLRIGVAVALIVAIVAGTVVSLVWGQLHLVQRVGHGARWMGPALATTLLIAVPIYPATVVMERELKFSSLGVIGIVQAVALFGTQVALLLLGAGLWSMVIAQIVGSIVQSVLTVRASGRFIWPLLARPVIRMVRNGLPFAGAVWATTLTGTATNVIVATQLGAKGFGYFAWCTILATPIVGALAAVHSVSVPTLARMRRDDEARYEESVGVLLRTMAVTAALAAGCLIGLSSPIVRYIFGVRWLPATGAVQFCLLGMLPTALGAVLYSDANARLLRRLTLISSLAGGLTTLIVLWPLARLDGVTGASAAANCIGPTVAVAVFFLGMRPPILGPLMRAIRLFAPLLGASFLLSRLARSPAEFVGASLIIGIAGLVAVIGLEGDLIRRLVRLIRHKGVAQEVPGPPSGGLIETNVRRSADGEPLEETASSLL